MRLSVTLNTSKAGDWKSRIERFVPAVRAAEEANAKRCVERAVALSQGVYSTADLRRMGHPYGWGRVPPANPAIINAQSRLFQGSWKYEIQINGDRRETVVFNSAPYAKFMAGTSKMIARPILDEMQKTERQKWFDGLKSAFASIFAK